MTGANRNEQVPASVDRCRSTFETARELLDIGDFDAAASRAYYAAFHAATAVFASRGTEFSKHQGLMAAVHRDLVRPGDLSAHAAKALDRLFELRDIGDYGRSARVAQEEAHEAVALARDFTEEILRLLRGTQD